VLPAEIRQQDRIEAGQEFDIELSIAVSTDSNGDRHHRTRVWSIRDPGSSRAKAS
jgi:hypothetical protein